jgi:hypothetical protein
MFTKAFPINHQCRQLPLGRLQLRWAEATGVRQYRRVGRGRRSGEAEGFILYLIKTRLLPVRFILYLIKAGLLPVRFILYLIKAGLLPVRFRRRIGRAEGRWLEGEAEGADRAQPSFTTVRAAVDIGPEHPREEGLDRFGFGRRWRRRIERGPQAAKCSAWWRLARRS